MYVDARLVVALVLALPRLGASQTIVVDGKVISQLDRDPLTAG